MRFLKVELSRLLRSKVTWLAVLSSAAAPTAGYVLYQPAGTGTAAASALANPLLAGAAGGSFIFATLTLFEMNRVKKDRMEPIMNSILSPLTANAVTISLLLTAAGTALFTALLCLPYTWANLGQNFQWNEYWKFAAIFLLPALLMSVLLASAFYLIFRRADLSFICFTAVMLAGLGPWNTDTYLLYWIDLSGLGFSGDLGNTSIYRMALYSRILWLCLFSGLWIAALLCVRNHGRNLLGSLLHNLRNICLPLLAIALFASGTALAVNQPYMDHEPPLTLDDGAFSTGGSMAVSMGPDAEEESGLSIRRIDADLRFDAQRGLLKGSAKYQIQNLTGKEQDCLLEVDPGCIVEQVTANGKNIPFQDLKNDHYMLTKNISLALPVEEQCETVITYHTRPAVPANTGALSLYFEITPEYISIGGYHLTPSFQNAVETENCVYSGQVTLPAEMELIASGKTPQRIRENGDGTATWHIQSSGTRTTIFAGNYVRAEIPEAGFPVYFCYSKNHQQEFEQMDILSMLNSTLAYCTRQYGPLPYTEDEPLHIVMTSAHMMGGGASRNLSYMGETFFTASNLNDPSKGGSAAEVIAHEIIHQWWGIQRFLYDMENTDWSSEALTCYTTYRLMKELHGEEYARKFYVDIWQTKYHDLQANYYLRNPEYLQMLPEKHQASLSALIFDSCTYAKAPLQILKAERLAGGEAEMDRILRELFQNGGTEMPPFITWQDFLDACGLTEDQLIIGGDDIG
ncbi:MAG: hypothetical protein K2O18_06015 [Oscillospiraceae bacterium]|nr:hypothetical protein [Oscillospiraceae bacterium]